MKGQKGNKSQLNILLPPEVQKDFREITYMERVSANKKASQLIQDYVETHKHLLDKYAKTFDTN